MYFNPLIIHNDGKIFLVKNIDNHYKVAQVLTDFADMVKLPEGVSTFELSPYALWSAAAKGYKSEDILSFLKDNSCNVLDRALESRIIETVRQYKSLELFQSRDYLMLQAVRPEIIEKVLRDKKIKGKMINRPNECTLLFDISEKVTLKKQLFKLELFAIDTTNERGKKLDIKFLKTTRSGIDFKFRDYQLQAVNSFLNNKDKTGGGGVIIMPPRSGKTFVGLKVIEKLKKNTLIITENDDSAASWKNELLDKTDLSEGSISFYNNDQKNLEPITITTYRYLTSEEQRIDYLDKQEWGLVIYDDAHKLPAPKYQRTSDISSKYKLALAATLARSDKKGSFLYALIGPKWYEILPQTLRQEGYLSNIECREVKVPLSEKDKENYKYFKVYSNDNGVLRQIAAKNDKKTDVFAHLIRPQKRTAIASYYKDIAKQIGDNYHLNYITGEIEPNIRKEIVKRFNNGDIDCLIHTQVGEQVNLRNLDVMISISYHGGSAREEYLRLGKLMEVDKRDKDGWFFSIISTRTIEESDYKNRRKSLINYGYRFKILDSRDLTKGGLNF
ncbi:DEAD/DEAH box helicase family protein [Natranaerobius trueperi]|uniref:DNA 3'-5' helicase n=1 Tax=Natranaerobius trueperi TaxID=759412 RepID=A0A226BX65_9FIRM|nr:DEAD/DEAH box helicase family protein [Natranaerobius trueperi]OWZ83372.1 hypothetical protein CDO51_09130 [Natranaerobius trueperi]